MPAYKRKYSSRSGSRKSARSSGSYSSSRSRKLMAARKGARLGYRKSGYKPRGKSYGTVTQKYVDTAHTSYTLNSTAVVTLIAVIPQGPDEINRLGRNVMLKSFQMRGEIQAGSTGVQTMVRWLLVYDRQPNRALPLITDILTSTAYNAMRNLDNVDRFVIICDKLSSVVGSSATTGTESAQRAVNKYVKLGNLIANYQVGTTGAIGEINTGALLLVTFGESPGTAAPNLSVTTRTRFVDA